jgi:hypothetical protein
MYHTIATIAITVFFVATRPSVVGNSDLYVYVKQLKEDHEPYTGCWHPGLSRNIGIAERAC